MYYTVFQEAGEDAGGRGVVEAGRAWCSDELGEGGWEVGAGKPGVGLEAAFGEEFGVEDYAQRGRRGGGANLGGDGGVLDVVQGEAGAVGGSGSPVLDGT